MKTPRKYAFSWDAATQNLESARPALGPSTRVEIYRLFQFTMRDVLEQRYGTEATDGLFREAGLMAGKAFFQHLCAGVTDFNELVKNLQNNLKAFGVGILRVEQADIERGAFTFTVDEDLDCSGLPDTAEEICVYDEGFIQGILESFTGKDFVVKEVDCWCTGGRTCRFTANLRNSE